MNWVKKTKEYIHTRPNMKKIIGIIFIASGFLAFITPLTPGSWLLIIGLELLGFRFLLSKNLLGDKNSRISNFGEKLLNYIKPIIILSIFIYLGLGTIFFFFQDNYIYFPDKTNFEECSQFANAEKIQFGSSRGYFTKRSADKVIIYYHGNAGRACDRNYLDIFFARQNYSTFFVEYSGYAEKNVAPSMTKLLNNVTDTITYINTKNFSHVVVIGESIGVGPAAFHALHSNIDNLILITAYNNLVELASSHHPMYPVSLILRNNFTPDQWLKNYGGKLSIILAENDEFIPNKLGQKLFEKIASVSKKMYTIKNSEHNTIYEKEEFYTSLEASL